MSVTGKIKTLFSDEENTEAVFPNTKVAAVSDNNGTGLNILLDKKVSVSDAISDTSTVPINADTLGGRPASEYASQEFVTDKIAEAALVINIPSEADLNDYVNPGKYKSASKDISQSLKNTPYTNGGFKLDVIPLSSNNYLMQEIRCNSANNKVFRRRASYSTSEWEYTDWYEDIQAKAGLNYTVGTNGVFNKLTDIGITTFPTTMKIVANSMPNNSTLMLDSRDIITGGINEISDLGIINAGMYMFMRGNSNSRVSIMHIYSATTASTTYMKFGNYAATNDTVTWYQVLDNSIVADYIVSQGWSGNWYYKKWNSGNYECWYRGNVTPASMSPLFLTAGYYIFITLPFTSVSTPRAMASIEHGTNYGVVTRINCGDKIGVYWETNSSTSNATLYLYVTGSWK